MKTHHIHASEKVTGKRRWASVEAARRRVKDGQMYFISRHGSWFRPDAHGYTDELAAAGIYDAKTARGYLDVNGLSVVPVLSMKAHIERQIAIHQKAAVALRDILTVSETHT